MQDSFFRGLCQGREDTNTGLAAGITLQELYAATLNLQNSRALGLDGLPVDFNKVFWEIIDGELLEVVSDNLKVGCP